MQGKDIVFVLIPIGISICVAIAVYLLTKLAVGLSPRTSLLCSVAAFIIAAVITLFIIPAPDF